MQKDNLDIEEEWVVQPVNMDSMRVGFHLFFFFFQLIPFHLPIHFLVVA